MKATIVVGGRRATVDFFDGSIRWTCEDSNLRAKCILFTPAPEDISPADGHPLAFIAKEVARQVGGKFEHVDQEPLPDGVL